MIRILYMSDLHLEMEPVRFWAGRSGPGHPKRGPALDGFAPIDLVVLAGDVGSGLRGIAYADEVAKYVSVPVVYVAGNHEFYHQYMHRLLPAFAAAAARRAGRLRFLENDVAAFTIRGETLFVLGCTLWTDYELLGDAQAAMRIAARTMNDHVHIDDGAGLFMPQNALAIHKKSISWLHETIRNLRRENAGAKILVVTHHAPGAAFLGDRVGEIAPAYASELLQGFAEYPPAAWIHGHTHYRHESEVNGIKVVSAPRGYASLDRKAAPFRPGFLVL